LALIAFSFIPVIAVSLLTFMWKEKVGSPNFGSSRCACRIVVVFGLMRYGAFRV